jgi:hypothetical protein
VGFAAGTVNMMTVTVRTPASLGVLVNAAIGRAEIANAARRAMRIERFMDGVSGVCIKGCLILPPLLPSFCDERHGATANLLASRAT